MRSGTIMAQLKFIDLFTLSFGGNRNQQGGLVILMWPAAPCSDLAAVSCGWELSETGLSDDTHLPGWLSAFPVHSQTFKPSHAGKLCTDK